MFQNRTIHAALLALSAFLVAGYSSHPSVRAEEFSVIADPEHPPLVNLFPSYASESPYLALHGGQSSAVVETFARGDQRRVVIANDSYSEPATFSLRPRNGRRLGKTLAALEAEKAVGRDGTPIWKLAPGGCLLVECPREDEP